MSILFAGTPENAAMSLRELVRSGVPISLVLTRTDSRVGRKQVLSPSPVALAAEELGIPVIRSNAVDFDTIAKIRAARVSFAVVIAYGVILRDAALEALPKGWFNLHYSLLPRWRGAAPVQRALISGDSETGVTLFKIDNGLDTGDILGTVSTKIQPSENSAELLNRLSNLGVSLLLEQLPRIESGLGSLSPQKTEGVSLAPKVSRSEAELDFKKSAIELENLTRGTNPEPGAWLALGKLGELKVFNARAQSTSTLNAGEFRLVSGMVLVGSSVGALELIEVQPSGKTRMNAKDWFRGFSEKLRSGEIV